MATTVLTAAGRAMRQRLAEAGVEITPAQLGDALLEAQRNVLRSYPDGLVPRPVWIRALQRALDRKVCS